MGSTFPGVIAFAFLASMILLGTVLRTRITFLQTNLVPASLIAGVLGFIFIAMNFSFGFVSADFRVFAFHFFTLSFMSLVLTGSDKPPQAAKLSVFAGGMWMSTVWVMSLVMQTLVGLGVIALYNQLNGESLSVFLGAIVTHGFTQGPGQALAMGNIWQSELGIEHAVDFGIAYASIGFLVAFVIGIPVARWAIRTGLNANKTARIDPTFLKGMYTEDSSLDGEPSAKPSAGRQITHAANVDSLVYHIAILGLAYLLTDQYLTFMHPIASDVTVNGVNFGILFSYNLFFIHGLIVCLLIRKLMDKFGLGHLIDNETQRRITGSAVDLMVAATLMSVEIAFLSEFAVPIFFVSIATMAATAVLCFGLARYLQGFNIERAVTVYGCCCGSTGSGLLLLRILDPDLSTPVAKELAFFNIAILFLSAHILMFMAPILPSFSLSTICMVYAFTFVAGVVMLLISSKMKKTNAVSEVKAV